MFKLILPLMLLGATSAQASFVAVTECNSESRTHTLKLVQSGEDVLAMMDNKKELNGGDFGGRNPGQKKYKVTAKILSTYRIQGISLPELRESGHATDLVASIMFSRPEFDGEYDMVYAYASELTHGLECK
ncbi:hypothetical protein EZJ49_13155 [Bdellovibrio bacteriovorus]|uniref:hypothetical protein n=1 Tax=Bdellovibrio bacteriovorus TaxID=959 RepID=UPI0021D3BAC3|nr:hypothetical protein [Bdellovibrio bacteriovorus]UXR64012.1 hypothetical protein EZJ49_13155 [Bdellovibrio bacteriovorus]